MKYLCTVLFSASCLLSGSLAISAVAPSNLDASEAKYLQTLYQNLHQNPELSFQEQETARRLAEEFAGAGFDVTDNIGGHGLVALLKNGVGPTVLVRTDMDALPVKEQTGKPYASRKTAVDEIGNTVPVMHACGHDIHMTAAIGVARWFSANKDQWQGTLLMVAQPAEERGAGSRAMLAEGLFERFPRPDFNLALHVQADLPAGMVSYTPEYAMANVDSVDILVKGVGGHGAYPHKTKDPVVLAARIITDLQTLVSRELSPLDPGVITVGKIAGGTKRNVIPDNVKLELTVRSYTDEVRKQLLKGIARVAKAAARGAGLTEDLLPEIVYGEYYTPAVYNDPALVQRLIPVLSTTLGANSVIERPPVMGGEDFARYGRQEPSIPSLMLKVGAVDPGEFNSLGHSARPLPSLHSPFFAPEPQLTIETGITAMTAMVLELMNDGGQQNTQSQAHGS